MKSVKVYLKSCDLKRLKKQADIQGFPLSVFLRVIIKENFHKYVYKNKKKE
jgi:predicted DNA binding CopG/RHH family protein